MAKEKLSWRTLGLIRGGRAGKAIDAAINRVLGDLEDRGDDGAARDVTIRLRLKPVKDGDGITTSVQCKTSMPALYTGSTVASLKPLGPGRAELEFSPDADRHDQGTLDFETKPDGGA